LFILIEGDKYLLDMKTVIALLGLTVFTAFAVKDKGEALYGTWQGAYGMNDEVKNAWVVLGANNSMEFYDGDLKPENKLSGTYKLLGDTAIVFTYKKFGKQQVIMEGNLNRSKNFVDGSWESNDHLYGSLFIQKQR
jgi:hypothetical protein